MKRIERTLTLYCPVCGNDMFSCVDLELDNLSDAPDHARMQCSDCKNIFTKAELMEGNQDIINANIEEIKQESLKAFEKELKKIFK